MEYGFYRHSGDIRLAGSDDGTMVSRIHVADIVSVVEASIERPDPGIVINVADDLPSTRYEVYILLNRFFACGGVETTVSLFRLGVCVFLERQTLQRIHFWFGLPKNVCQFCFTRQKAKRCSYSAGKWWVSLKHMCDGRMTSWCSSDWYGLCFVSMFIAIWWVQ